MQLRPGWWWRWRQEFEQLGGQRGGGWGVRLPVTNAAFTVNTISHAHITNLVPSRMSLKWKHHSVYKFTWLLGPRTGWSIFVIMNPLPLSLSFSLLRAEESDVIKTCRPELLHRQQAAPWLCGLIPRILELFPPKPSSPFFFFFNLKKKKSRDNGWESGNARSRCQSHLSHLCQLQ